MATGQLTLSGTVRRHLLFPFSNGSRTWTWVVPFETSAPAQAPTNTQLPPDWLTKINAHSGKEGVADGL